MIFFIYFLKSHGQLRFYTYVEFQGVSSLTPGRVSAPEHPGPSVDALSDIFCVSRLSAVNSPSAVHSAVHTVLSLLVFVCLGAGIWVHAPALLKPDPSHLLHAPDSLACRLLGLLLSLPPVSLWELWDYSADCGSPHPACYLSLSEPAPHQAWEAKAKTH